MAGWQLIMEDYFEASNEPSLQYHPSFEVRTFLCELLESVQIPL